MTDETAVQQYDETENSPEERDYQEFRGIMVSHDGYGNITVGTKDFESDLGEYIFMLETATAKLKLINHMNMKQMAEAQRAEMRKAEKYKQSRQLLLPGQ